MEICLRGWLYGCLMLTMQCGCFEFGFEVLGLVGCIECWLLHLVVSGLAGLLVFEMFCTMF